MSRKPLNDQKKTKAISKKSKNRKLINFDDVLQSKPKFLIFSTLSMYPEITLNQMKKIVGKSKSTIWFHLNAMKDAEIVEVVREELISGKIPMKYYRLVPDFEEKIKNIDSDKVKHLDDKKTKYYKYLKGHLTFSQTQVHLLEIWQKYLISMMKSIENEEFDSIKNELHDFKDETFKLTNLSYFTNKTAQHFLKKVVELINTTEEHSAKFEAEKVHPNYVGVQVLPIKRAMDFFL